MKSREFEKPRREIIVVVHNIRSVLNVGSIFRTCEGFGILRIFLSGTTLNAENQLPHVRAKMAKELHKTALGAETIVPYEFVSDVFEFIKKLKDDGFQVVGLEQDARAVPLPNYPPPTKSALLIGEEVHGLTDELRDVCDDLIEIPMFGRKESFNVSVATGIALYELSKRIRNNLNRN
ncbi:TrmH family RNA methyltransferase [Candidatus Saccharibacteria bacterium]|nr:TrmH family RNA methyltransferase [Candidatus Saccharibacteria bacterium]